MATQPLRPALISETTTDAILQEEGDYVYARVGKNGTKIIKAKNKYGKRSAVKYKSGKIVETISY